MYKIEDITNKILQGNSLFLLREIPDNTVDLCITSPPYFNLRSYGSEPQIWSDNSECQHEWEESLCKKCDGYLGELGQEPTPDRFVKNLALIFKEVYRVLKPTGSCYINIDDTFNQKTLPGIKKKSMMMVPERLALSLLDIGYVLRNKIIWTKKNSMPECLDINTRVFVKNNENIEQITLKELSLKDWRNYYILSDGGWNKIKNLWKTKKSTVKFKAGCIDDIICSTDHRFAITRDTHRNRKFRSGYKSIKDINKTEKSWEKLLYTNISNFFNVSKKTIDIMDLGNKWVVDFNHLSKKEFVNFIGKTPLELAILINDKTLRKHRYTIKNGKKSGQKTWTYFSKTHFNYRFQLIDPLILNKLNIKFDKIKSFHSPKIENRFFDLDYELGWLIGIYIAEGGFNNPRGHQGKITMNKKETDIVNKFAAILLKKFGIKSKINFIDNFIDCVFSSATLHCLTNFIVPGKCKTKKLNINYLLNTPKEFRQGIWDGYMLGDGSITRTGKSVASASKYLIYTFQTLASTLGILTSIAERKCFDKRFGKKYLSYSLWTNMRYRFDMGGKYSFVRIKDYQETNEEREMIDVETDGNHLFVIENGLVSHNSCSDRYSTSWEYVFFFTKNPKYYFEQQFEPMAGSSLVRAKYGTFSEKTDTGIHGGFDLDGQRAHFAKILSGEYPGRNCRDVWSIATQSFTGSHFAVFNSELIEKPIKASCPEFICTKCGEPRKKLYAHDGEIKMGSAGSKTADHIGVSETSSLKTKTVRQKIDMGWSDCGCGEKFEAGIVLDPFFGSGTTGITAQKLGRNFIGLEINPEYAQMAEKRLKEELGLFSPL